MQIFLRFSIPRHASTCSLRVHYACVFISDLGRRLKASFSPPFADDSRETKSKNKRLGFRAVSIDFLFH